MASAELILPRHELEIVEHTTELQAVQQIDPQLEKLLVDNTELSPEEMIALGCGDSRLANAAGRMILGKHYLQTFGAMIGVADAYAMSIEARTGKPVFDGEHYLDEMSYTIGSLALTQNLMITLHTDEHAEERAAEHDNNEDIDPGCTLATLYVDVKKGVGPDDEAIYKTVREVIPHLDLSEQEFTAFAVASQSQAERLRPSYKAAKTYSRLTSEKQGVFPIPLVTLTGDHAERGFAFFQGKNRAINNHALHEIGSPLFTSTNGQYPRLAEATRNILPVDARDLEIATTIVAITLREKFFAKEDGSKLPIYRSVG